MLFGLDIKSTNAIICKNVLPDRIKYITSVLRKGMRKPDFFLFSFFFWKEGGGGGGGQRLAPVSLYRKAARSLLLLTEWDAGPAQD